MSRQRAASPSDGACVDADEIDAQIDKLARTERYGEYLAQWYADVDGMIAVVSDPPATQSILTSVKR